LGSSDMPVLMGVSPYSKTPADVYWSKVGGLPDEKPEQYKQTGNWLEDSMLDWAAEELGVSIIRNQFRVARGGPAAQIFAANCDALIRDKEEGLEAKFANGEMALRYGEPGTGEVPDDIVVQVQHQMYCAGLQRVWVPVAVPSYWGIDRRLYRVERDEDLIKMISEFGRDWWNEHVVNEVPPEGAETPPMQVLKALDRRLGKSVDLGADVAALIDRHKQLQAAGKACEREIDEIKAQIIHALGDAEIGFLPDGQKITYYQYERAKFDQKRLERERPEIATQYAGKSFYRTLYVKAAKRRAKSA